MKIFRSRKTVAILALLIGGALVFFELYRPTSRGEACFWVALGGAMVVLALIELLTNSTPTDGPLG